MADSILEMVHRVRANWGEQSLFLTEEAREKRKGEKGKKSKRI